MLMLGLLQILLCNTVQKAFAWGTLGHEEIQGAAIRLLVEQNHPLAKYFHRNLATLKRLSTVPDTDWKATAGVSPKKTKNPIKFREQGLHYFEVDAFLRAGTEENAILMLPADEYRIAAEKYRKLLRENVAYILEYERNQSDPAAYGTAPWRVLQLYDLSVTALKQKDAVRSLFYLGLLSHYVGDLAEPLNTTLGFEGRHYPMPATGVYSAFEEKIFDDVSQPAQRANATATVSKEAAYAVGGKGLEGLTRPRIVWELLHLVDTGHRYVDPVLKAFSEQCAVVRRTTNGRGLASLARAKKETQLCEPPIEAAKTNELIRSFAATAMASNDVAAPADTVIDIAFERLGEAAAVVARFWAAAYNEAGRPTLVETAVAFEELRVGENYVAPDYLSNYRLQSSGR